MAAAENVSQFGRDWSRDEINQPREPGWQRRKYPMHASAQHGQESRQP